MAASVTSCSGGARGSPGERPRPSRPIQHLGGSGKGPSGNDQKHHLLSRPAESPDEAAVADQESEDDLSASRTSLERQAPHRGNTMVHVCWHRNTSVSMVDFSVAVEVRPPARRSMPARAEVSCRWRGRRVWVLREAAWGKQGQRGRVGCSSRVNCRDPATQACWGLCPWAPSSRGAGPA